MHQNVWRAMMWAILSGCLIVAPASAIVGPKKASSSKTSTAGNTAAVVTALHQAKTLLDTAIHDYDGHRGKAVAEIHHAIHELTPHTGAHKTATGKTAAKGAKETTTPGENQVQSDNQLKEALKILEGLNGQIPNSHPKAATHLQTAVAELNTALKIK